MTGPRRPPWRSAVTPMIASERPEAAADFAKQVFGATTTVPPVKRRDGSVWMVEIEIGGAAILIAARQPGRETATALYVYVDDCDATFAKALEYGAVAVMEPAEQFHGEYSGGVRDPDGTTWWISTMKELLTPEEVQARAAGPETPDLPDQDTKDPDPERIWDDPQ